MKFRLSLAALLLAGLLSSAYAQTVTWPDTVQSEVTVNNYQQIDIRGMEAGLSWYHDNIEASYRLSFFTLLFDQVRQGRIRVKDPAGKTVSLSDAQGLDDLFVKYCDTISLTRPYPPYDEFDTIVCPVVEPYEITDVLFRELWSFDATTLRFSKTVIEYAPVATFEDYDEDLGKVRNFYKPLFWVICDPTAVPDDVLCPRFLGRNVRYTSDITGIEVDTTSLNKFRQGVVERALKDDLKLYAFDPNLMIEEDPREVDAEHMLYHTDTVLLVNPEPPYNEYDYVTKSEPAFYSGLQFMEEWRIDLNTLSIVKNVVGVSPYQNVYLEGTDEFMGIRRLYWLFYGELWSPFHQNWSPEK